MIELNQKTLHEGLQNLKNYPAPGDSWQQIAGQLDSEQKLSKAVRGLPVYTAPSNSWELMEYRIRKGKMARLWLSRAATITVLILVGSGIFLKNRQPHQQIQVSYSMENRQIPMLTDLHYEEDEALITGMFDHLDRSTFLSQNPELIELKSEYAELKEANELLRALISQYGADPSLAQQLKDIEFQRNDLAKEISNHLLYLN